MLDGLERTLNAAVASSCSISAAGGQVHCAGSPESNPDGRRPAARRGASPPRARRPDIQLFKYDDLRLWVTDGRANRRTAVAQRGSGDASVHVLYATSGSQLAPAKATG